jgi:hypothetical protein
MDVSHFYEGVLKISSGETRRLCVDTQWSPNSR